MSGNDDELDLGGAPTARGRISRLISQEFGEQAAQTFHTVWRAFEEWEQRQRPDEGLRERKKRQTRQRISDVATALFVNRGFDSVTISEIAELVGVSEKTVYNYFPTKESLVYDNAEEQLRRLTAAVRDRDPGVSPVAAFVAELKAETARFADLLGDARVQFMPQFGEMVRATPALRAAWGEHRHRLVAAISATLSDDFGVDPRDPEVLVAARALVSLLELFFDSQLRHAEEGIRGTDLQGAVEDDLDRGARLLDTGLWSMQLLVGRRRNKQQLRDAAVAAEQARQQVMAALRDAKRAWKDAHEQAKAAAREEAAAMRTQAVEARERGRAQAAEARERARAQAAEARARGRTR